MPEHYAPNSPAQVAELVSWALAEDKALVIHGAGTKAGFGFPVTADVSVSMRGLEGIVSYEPTELVMTARAGTALEDIQAALAVGNQHLAFEPMQLGKLYSSDAPPGTIGGVFMGNLSGPRRFTAGGARDHILGIKAVNGRGEAYQSGGSVLKNVTGYDLSKLLAGSWGTLSILTEVTFKVLPAPVTSTTVAVSGQTPQEALATLKQLAQSPVEPSGLAYVPAHTLSLGSRSECIPAGVALTAIRLEGSELSVKERTQAVLRQLPADYDHRCLTAGHSIQLWEAIRDVAPFESLPDAVILKASVPPAMAGTLILQLQEWGACHWYLDAAGGWCWIALGGSDRAASIHTLKQCIGTDGALVLCRAPETVKRAAGIGYPSSGPLAELTRRVESAFDPRHLFNPGRLVP